MLHLKHRAFPSHPLNFSFSVSFINSIIPLILMYSLRRLKEQSRGKEWSESTLICLCHSSWCYVLEICLLCGILPIHGSFSSIDDQTRQLAQTSKDVEQRVNTVLEHSQSVYNQTLKISDSQMELQNGQIKISKRIDEGMTMLNESANKLGEEMVSLRNESVEIEKEWVKWEMRFL
ncbi:hypothetical protein Hanom_Chr05g00450081 [Helianthus anomalus]